MNLVAGVDSSTQSTKVEIREIETGNLIATGRAGHPSVHPPVSEQDPDSWWDALVDALSQVSDHLGEVQAVSVVAQQHGLVCLDADGDPIRPAKLWNDTTSASQARALVERLGADVWAQRCGLVPVSSITITKLAWLVDNEPHVVAGADAFMLPHDFLTFRLSGQPVTDRGDASGTGWWSPVSEDYEPELLGLVVEDPQGLIERLPRVLGPKESAGVVAAEAAAVTGLTAGIPVACGTGDNMGSAYALGLEPGDIVMSLGTSGTVFAVTEHAITDPSGIVAGFADATGRYLPLVATLNATGVTDTVARWLGADRAELAELALQALPDPSLVLKPYFDGERTPNLPDARGSFFGLGNETTRGDIAAAAHIGVVCGLMYGIDALASSGVNTTGRLHLTGGGARSVAFQQWVADIWGRRLAVHVDDESAAAGACKQAVVAATGIEAAWRLTPDLVADPRPGVDGGLYRDVYDRIGS
ncbi:MAG: xylulokinase [Acidimicrobiia bacterium]